MNCKNCGLRLLALAGVLLAVSIVYPNGPTFQTKPVEPVTPVAPHETDPTIVRLLEKADPADRARIVSVYSGLIRVLEREAQRRLMTTTEQWEMVHANTLALAIDQPGKYPGLDEAIEAVFVKKCGTDDVLPVNPETRAKLLDAAAVIVSSAR